MKNEPNIFRYELTAVRHLYRSYCAEQGIKDGLWRWRHVFGVLPALIMLVAVYVAYSYGGPYFHTYGDSLLGAPIGKAILSFLVSWFMFSAIAEALCLRHRIVALESAGIEIPEAAIGPSFKELVRDRKNIRRQYRLHCREHGRWTHAYWAIAQLAISLFFLFFPVALLLSGYANDDVTLSSSVLAGVSTVIMVWAYIEWIYLDHAWRKVNRHEPCSICAPEANSLRSRASQDKTGSP